jgi:hypothetical protein
MKRIDKKVLKTIYKQFLKTRQNYQLKTKSIAHELKKDIEEIHKSVDILIGMKYVKIEGRAEGTCYISLTDEGMKESRSFSKPFYEKLDWLKILGWIIAFLLGLFADEIKDLII